MSLGLGTVLSSWSGGIRSLWPPASRAPGSRWLLQRPARQEDHRTGVDGVLQACWGPYRQGQAAQVVGSGAQSENPRASTAALESLSGLTSLK